jgi:Zn-dependent peptidase ImmA (M78 family)
MGTAMVTEAIINPELLIWARVSAGMSVADAVARLKISGERLSSWESGNARPSLPQLRKLAALYKRPIAVFYLTNPPKHFQAMHDFRRLPLTALGTESPELRLEIRKAHYRRGVALDLYASLNESPPKFSTKMDLDAETEDLAASTRLLLAIDPHEQQAWKSEYEALNAWRNAVESLGALVFQAANVDLAEMRGFSLALNPLPVIAINIKDTPRARIFSLLHEFAHIMLREEGICDLDEGARQRSDDRRIEVRANMIAGATLVPKENLLREKIVADRRRETEFSDDDIRTIAKKYWVSRPVVLRRLLLLEQITQKFYRRKAEQYEEEFRSSPKSPGFVLPHVAAISRSGEHFVRLVLDSYAQEKITSSDLSDFLEVRLKHLPRIQDEVLRRTHTMQAGA